MYVSFRNIHSCIPCRDGFFTEMPSSPPTSNWSTTTFSFQSMSIIICLLVSCLLTPLPCNLLTAPHTGTHMHSHTGTHMHSHIGTHMHVSRILPFFLISIPFSLPVLPKLTMFLRFLLFPPNQEGIDTLTLVTPLTCFPHKSQSDSNENRH